MAVDPVERFAATLARRQSDLRARQRATRLAFHLSNALIELEAIERLPRTDLQGVAVARVREALLDLAQRTEKMRRAYPDTDELPEGARS